MKKVLEYILNKFPDQRPKIIDLYNYDEDFRTLCEDLLVSVETLEKCRLNGIKDKKFEDEFIQVYVELEKEIIHLLEMNRSKK